MFDRGRGDQVARLADQADPAGDDSVLVRLGRRTEAAALDQHSPLVRLPEAGQGRGERALAGAVAAEQSVDLARRQPQVEPVQRGHTGEPDRQILRPNAQRRLGLHRGGEVCGFQGAVGHQASP
jgi:hypothetical protein